MRSYMNVLTKAGNKTAGFTNIHAQLLGWLWCCRACFNGRAHWSPVLPLGITLSDFALLQVLVIHRPFRSAVMSTVGFPRAQVILCGRNVAQLNAREHKSAERL